MIMRLNQEQFSALVEEALDSLPEKILAKLHNVAVVAEDFPSREIKKSMKLKSDWDLLGLFEGFAQARRLNFGPVLPDKITIFRQPILKSAASLDDCRRLIADTVRHEIAHHFGLDEKGARQAAQKKVNRH